MAIKLKELYHPDLTFPVIIDQHEYASDPNLETMLHVIGVSHQKKIADLLINKKSPITDGFQEVPK